MILEYSYEKAVKVLELLKESKIATLEMHESEGKTAMEYTLVSEYPIHVQAQITRVFNESLPKRVRFIEMFNDIIVTKAAGEKVKVDIHMNAVHVRNLDLTYECIGTLIKRGEEDNLVALRVHLKGVDDALTAMGISSQKINAYHREGGGRQKKYTQLTLGELSSIIEKALEE